MSQTANDQDTATCEVDESEHQRRLAKVYEMLIEAGCRAERPASPGQVNDSEQPATLGYSEKDTRVEK